MKNSPSNGLWLALALVAVAACAPERPAPVTEAERPPSSAPVAPAPAGTAPSAPAPPDRRPPTTAEARDALNRIFGAAVSMAERPAPAALAGDLNGDDSPDLVAVVRPEASSVGALNDELANWILREPRAPQRPHPTRAQVAAGDVLLVVLHGVGPAGWRSPEARQVWLLRGVAGDGLQVLRPAAVRPASGGERLPRLWGDVLAESLDGRPGFLFWTGAKYDWYQSPPVKR